MARTLEEKVRIIRRIINNRYRKIIPETTQKRLMKIKVNQISPRDWRRHCDRYLAVTRQQYVERMKIEEPERLEQLKQHVKTYGGELSTHIDNSRRRSGIGNPQNSGYYDPFGDQIAITTDDVPLIAHELLHAYSHNAYGSEYRGRWSNFRQFVPHEANESLTDLLAAEVTKEYYKKHLQPGEAVSTQVSGYNKKKGPDYLKKYGRLSALHGYFGGYFRADRGGNPLPCLPNEYKRYARELRRGRAKPIKTTPVIIPTPKPKPKGPKTHQPGTTPIKIMPIQRLKRRGPEPKIILKHGSRRTLGGSKAQVAGVSQSASNPSALSIIGRPLLYRRGQRTVVPALQMGSTGAKLTSYKVRAGETLSSIAKRYSGSATNWRELYRLNRVAIGKNPNLIRPGSHLRLPPTWNTLGSSKFSPNSHTGPIATRYQIAKGDTLSRIALRMTGNASRWRELYQLNRGVIGHNPNLIRSGVRLRLPSTWTAPSTSSGARTSLSGDLPSRYRIMRGDTLSGIAYRMTGDASRWRDLYKLNKSTIGNNPNLIRTGQSLNLPPAWKRPQSRQPSALSRYSVGLS